MSIHSKYSLLKYSRSYPPDDPGHIAVKPTSADAVWQHFSFPELYLSFGRNDKGELQTAILKIHWTKDTLLEELDLLSFKSRSSSSSFIPSQSSQIQNVGPSLRVVYRDSVVGFKYTTSCQKNFTAQSMVRDSRYGNGQANDAHTLYHTQMQKYRRFQISFTDPSAATQFVNMIVPICPCKLSSQSNLTTATISRLPLYAQNYSSPQCSQSQNQSMNAPEIDPQYASFIRGNEINTSQTVPQSGPGQYTNQPIHAEPSTSLPESSLQTTIEQSKTTLTSDIEQLVLTDIEQLKNVNPEQLEKLIARLLRRPDFTSLLEKLDSLWKIKGLIGDRIGLNNL